MSAGLRSGLCVPSAGMRTWHVVMTTLPGASSFATTMQGCGWMPAVRLLLLLRQSVREWREEGHVSDGMKEFSTHLSVEQVTSCRGSSGSSEAVHGKFEQFLQVLASWQYLGMGQVPSNRATGRRQAARQISGAPRPASPHARCRQAAVCAWKTTQSLAGPDRRYPSRSRPCRYWAGLPLPPWHALLHSRRAHLAGKFSKGPHFWIS